MSLFVQLTLIVILIVERFTVIVLHFMEPKLVMLLFLGPGIDIADIDSDTYLRANRDSVTLHGAKIGNVTLPRTWH